MLIPSSVLSNNNARLKYLYNSADLGSGTSKTVTNVPFGTASATRVVVIGVVHALVGTSTVNSVTIGGVTATKICQANGSNAGVSLFAAVVPTGTSGTVVITWGTSVARCYICSYSLDNLNSSTVSDYDAPAAGGGGTEATRTATINVPKGGAVIALAYTATYAQSFTGVDTDYIATETANGSKIVMVVDTTYDVSLSSRAICAAVWR